MPTPSVFIPNSTVHASKLESWGRVVPIFKSYIYPDETDNMFAYAEKAYEALQGFNPADDFIGLTGDPGLCSLIVAIVVRSQMPKFNVLKYDQKLNAFYKLTIDTRTR